MNHPTPITIEEAHSRTWLKIEPGMSVEFVSEVCGSEDYTPRSGQTVEVLRALTEHEADPENPMWKVRFPDGFEGDVWEEEISGWDKALGQYVGHPSFASPDPGIEHPNYMKETA